jgi:hypothetical protein
MGEDNDYPQVVHPSSDDPVLVGTIPPMSVS